MSPRPSEVEGPARANTRGLDWSQVVVGMLFAPLFTFWFASTGGREQAFRTVHAHPWLLGAYPVAWVLTMWLVLPKMPVRGHPAAKLSVLAGLCALCLVAADYRQGRRIAIGIGVYVSAVLAVVGLLSLVADLRRAMDVPSRVGRRRGRA